MVGYKYEVRSIYIKATDNDEFNIHQLLALTNVKSFTSLCNILLIQNRSIPRNSHPSSFSYKKIDIKKWLDENPDLKGE